MTDQQAKERAPDAAPNGSRPESGSARFFALPKTDLDLIDVPIVLAAGLGLALFLIWFGRQSLQAEDMQLPGWIQNPFSWLVTAPITAVGWFIQKAVRKQRRRPIGQSYLMWIFCIAIGTILTVLGIRIPLRDPAQRFALAGDTTTVRRITLERASGATSSIEVGNGVLSDTALAHLEAFLRSSQFRVAASTYALRQVLVGMEETGMAVEASGREQRYCDGFRPKPKDVYAAAYHLPCRTSIRVVAAGVSTEVEVLDKAGSDSSWRNIRLALSPAAMKLLGLEGKGEVRYTVLGLAQ